MNVELEPLVPWTTVGAAALALLAAELGPLALRRRPLSRSRLAAIALFSGLATAAAVAPLAGPQLTHESRREVRAAVLVDASRSMATRDAAGGRTRYEAALEAARSLERATKARVKVEACSRGDAAAAGQENEALPEEPAGETTALGDALARALARAPREREPLAAIVLVSDGGQRSGRDPVAAARDAFAAGARVFTVAAGTATAGAAPRLRRATLTAPERAPAASTATVRAAVELEGLEGAPVELELEVDGRVIARETTIGSGPRATREAAFEVELGAEGIRALALRARAGSRAIAAATRVRVLPGRVRVALVDSPARWEHRYLRRALEDAPRIELERVDLWGTGRAASEATAAAIAAVGSADVVILGDVPPRALGPEVGRAIARAVEEGRGLLVLGGRRGFEGAVELGLEPLLPAPVPRGTLPLAQSFRPIATGAGRALLQGGLGLDAARVDEALERMPSLPSFVPLAPALRDSTVLLEGPARRPLVATGRRGLGRTGVLASDATWRWAFPGSDGGPQTPAVHAALIRQLVLEVAPRDAGLRAPLELASAGHAAPGELVTVAIALDRDVAADSIEATLRDASGRVLSRTSLDAPATKSSTTLEIPRDAGPGPIELRAVALAGGHEIARAERIVDVTVELAEEPGEPADRALLDRISDAGGGATFSLEDVERGTTAAALSNALDAARPSVRETSPLVAGPSYVLLLAVLLGATWAARRTGGLP